MVEYLTGSSLSTSYNLGIGSVIPLRLVTPLTSSGIRTFTKLTEFGYFTKCIEAAKCLTEFGETIIRRRKITNEASSLSTSYMRVTLKYGHFNSPYITIEVFNNNICDIEDVASSFLIQINDVGNVNTIQIGL